MYHPAAALRTPAIERESYADIANVPATLIESRRRRETASPSAPQPTPIEAIDPTEPEVPVAAMTADTTDEPVELTLF